MTPSASYEFGFKSLFKDRIVVFFEFGGTDTIIRLVMKRVFVMGGTHRLLHCALYGPR